MSKTAIIGAGITGLSCADELTRMGHDVTLFERARGLGGRIAARRNERGLMFDHGAQFVTARSTKFRELLENARDGGQAAIWKPRRHPEMLAAVAADWYVGVPTMSDLVASLAADLRMEFGVRLTEARLSERGWQLRGGGQVWKHYEQLVVALPAPQVGPLLGESLPPLVQLDQVKMAPCWAAMLAFDEPLDLTWDAWSASHETLAWAGRNSSKPGRASTPETWVLHADSDWSRAHDKIESGRAGERLLAAFESLAGKSLPTATSMDVMRWHFARTTTPLGKPFLALPEMRLHVGGAWCLGGRVESGFESGRAMAADVARSVGAA